MALLRVEGALLKGSKEPYLLSKEPYLLSKEPYLCVYSIDKYINIHIMYMYIPPKKLLGGGISTPYTLFCLICTINSELTYFPMCTTIEWAGVDIRGFEWMGSTPAGFQEAFCADMNTCIYSIHVYTVDFVATYVGWTFTEWIEYIYIIHIYICSLHSSIESDSYLFYTCKCSRFRVVVCRVNIYRIDCIHLYNTYVYIACIQLHWIWPLHLFYACKCSRFRIGGM